MAVPPAPRRPGSPLKRTATEAPTVLPGVGSLKDSAAVQARRAGKFVLGELLGAGAMGEVWRARDPELGRDVALKFLKGADEALLARFRREAQTVGRLDHPHIAALYEVGESEGRPFIAMQLVEGRTLKDWPGRDPRELAALVRDAARGVAHAHSRGVVHRDLKPENLMAGAGPAGPHVYVMDFGLARAVEGESGLSAAGQIVGTPSYLSPEQARGEPAGPGSDVYGLGATLYALLAGRPPHRGKTLLDTLRQVIEVEPEPLRGVDRDLATIVSKCLEKDPDRRYESADALADDLERWLAEEPILARPGTAAYRLRKRLARRRVPVAIAAGAVLVIGATLAILLPRLSDARERTARESAARREAEGRQVALQELQTIRTRLMAAVEWTRQAFRKPEDIRAELKSVEARLDEFLRAHERMPEAWLLRANARLQLGELEEAKEDAGRALGLDPASAAGAASAMVLELATAAVEAPEGSLEPRLPEFAERARRLSGLPEQEIPGHVAFLRYLAADRSATDALPELVRRARTSSSEELCFWLASIGPPAGRLDWAKLGVEIAPHNPLVRFARGRERFVAGDRAGALEDLEHALRLHPTWWTARVNRAWALHELGRTSEALQEAESLVAGRPRLVAALLLRGSLRAHAGIVAGVREDAASAVHASPATGEGDFLFGQAARLEGNRAEALRLFGEAVRKSPAWPLPRFARARLLIDQERVAEALSDLDTILALQPWSPEFLAARGYAHGKNRDWALSVADLDRAIELGSRDPWAYINRGLARTELGNRAGAISDLRRALELPPAPGLDRQVVLAELESLEQGR